MSGQPVETELKFQVPPPRRAALRRAVLRARVERVRMVARYFDTADGRLAAAGLALRLRREGRTRWVQTLKGRGDGLMQRLEHEVVLPSSQGTPALDLSRHDGTPVGALLRDVLAGRQPVERFATEITRTRRTLRADGGSFGTARVELALDEGCIRAGTAERAVCELEFELLSGTPQAMLALAARWVEQHGLWLDVRSKAEMGHRLAAGLAIVATSATAPIVSARMGPRRALAALLQNCLAQVLPNLAEVADATATGDAEDGTARAEALHQLRVGLRRTRTALREFGRGVDAVNPAWDGVLAEAFRELGMQRDADIVGGTLAPALAAARAAGLGDTPAEAGGAAPAGEPAAAPRAAAFNTTLLELIGFEFAAAEQPDTAEAAEAAPLLARARQRLKRLHRGVTEGAERFGTLPDEERHRLRKRAKRLRYTLEFCAPLFGRKASARYLRPLREVQQCLGDYNDLGVAEAVLAKQTTDGPSVAFLRGWVAARRDAVVVQCERALQALAQAPRPWR